MSAMQNRFSPAAARVLTWTQAEAERLGSKNVEPEHLLLGLLEENEGSAINILQRLGINIEDLKHILLQRIKLIEKAIEGKPKLSLSAQKVLDLGMESANNLQVRQVGTEHLLIGLLRNLNSKSYTILRRSGVNYNQVLSSLKTLPPKIISRPQNVQQVSEPEEYERLSVISILSKTSMVFWGMVIILIGSGLAAYNRWVDPGIAVFLFVAVGWIVSVSLHEFGHALVAYWAGDKSVINKGYLTLNPLKYTHGTLSIILPLVILVMGGIGLPGGVVYINMAAIPNKKMRSLVSAAGPIMTALFTLFLVTIISIGTKSDAFVNHLEFWAGISFLAFLQITAFVFNMIPLPPLDGFGILMPFLPMGVVRSLASLGRFTFLIIMFVFFSNNPLREFFWKFISTLIEYANLNPELVGGGINLFRFWN